MCAIECSRKAPRALSGLWFGTTVTRRESWTPRPTFLVRSTVSCFLVKATVGSALRWWFLARSVSAPVRVGEHALPGPLGLIVGEEDELGWGRVRQ